MVESLAKTCDFHGWATKANIKCSDGRVITKDAFKHNDGNKVPLCWNHNHDDVNDVLGYAILEHCDEGVYTYCFFNDTESGQTGKLVVEHGDITMLSIYANQLKQQAANVMHGNIREVSLVHAGANPGARIEEVSIRHNDDDEFEARIFTGENFTLVHAEEKTDSKEETNEETETETKKSPVEIYNEMSKEQQEAVCTLITFALENGGDIKHGDDESDNESEDLTIGEIYDKMTPAQKEAVAAMIGLAVEQSKLEHSDDETSDEETLEHSALTNNETNNNESEGGNETMKVNVFDQDEKNAGGVLSHADQESIIEMAKRSNIGSLRAAIDQYVENNESLKHGIDEIETLFPEYQDVKPGAPELLERDMTWVGHVMRKTHKSPISRIRTRQADARGADLRAKGYQKKVDEKTLSGNIKLMGRTTDPQTIYRKDALHRDDIIDITDFNVVEYQYGVMKNNIYEDIALATMVGDLREDGDPDKIQEEHIRPIWKDDELYTIHYDVDVAKAKAELQGSNTGANFGENYIYAEALITASLYSREQYKGSGNLEFYCTPHLLNVMLLARDLNGRRIYDSKAELEKALNVSAIHTAEQFEGLTRTTKEGKTKKLLGIFVNLADYQHGSTKGGEITRFEQFDIDFNLNKYLIETRLSGALVKVKSAIALEEPVEAGTSEG